ncbi:MAG TPA: DUF4386 domain-containing protein [Candidatus Dormibacteraeota bacterium]|nr:DUF4386 domain-containing protein [Candidatus Dormibacteraeota bacterium]HEV2477511.1 DUF4386 domain-containing protein [Candidatus Dormibacteraeota bacterium]
MQPVNRSVQLLARIAGAFYLVNIVAGAFAIGYVSSVAPTIQANETLFRAGIAAHLIVTLTNPPLTMIFYELFKVVNRRLALLAAFFSLVATGVEGAGLFVQVEHPVVRAYDVYTAFFGFDLMTIGYLVYRSSFLPRAIGVLLLVDGVSYLVYSFVDILVPGLAAHLVPWIQLPILAGEGSLTVWLLVSGVNAARWTERAGVSSTSLAPVS